MCVGLMFCLLCLICFDRLYVAGILLYVFGFDDLDLLIYLICCFGYGLV